MYKFLTAIALAFTAACSIPLETVPPPVVVSAKATESISVNDTTWSIKLDPKWELLSQTTEQTTFKTQTASTKVLLSIKAVDLPNDLSEEHFGEEYVKYLAGKEEELSIIDASKTSFNGHKGTFSAYQTSDKILVLQIAVGAAKKAHLVTCLSMPKTIEVAKEVVEVCKGALSKFTLKV
jgi:hypothetical protein